MGAPDVDPPCGATTDAGLRAAARHGRAERRHRSRPGDQCQPDHGQRGGKRQRRRHCASRTSTARKWSPSRRRRRSGTRSTVTNNIIANNVAGWDGAGISLLDALNGEHHQQHDRCPTTPPPRRECCSTRLGLPWPARQGPNCISKLAARHRRPQPAGLVSIQNSAVLSANLPATVTCPAGHFAGTTATNGTCRQALVPAAVQQRVLAEPFVLHRRRRPRCGNPEPAERGHAV